MYSNELFAVGYFFGMLAVTIGTLAFRGWVARRGAGDERGELDPFEAAYLAGGPDLAVSAAVQALAARGLVRVDPASRALAPAGEAARPLPPLERAVHDAVRHGARFGSQVRAEVAAELARLEAGLIARGLRPSAARRRGYRLAPAVAIAILALVALGWYLGGRVDPPLGGGADDDSVVMVACFAGIASFVLALGLLVPAPNRTAFGAKRLKDLREAHRPRALASRGTQETHTPFDAALLIGLFGLSIFAEGPLTALAAEEGGKSWRADLDIDVDAGCGEGGDGGGADGGGGDGGGDGGGGDGGGDGGGCGGGGCGGGGD